MHRGRLVGLAAIAALLLGPALAAAEDLDEVTMQVIGNDEADTSAAMRHIELPAQASETGRERSQRGLDQANQSRERNRERQRLHEEQGDTMREQRQEMQENRDRVRERIREQVEQQREERQQQGPGGPR